MRSTVIDSRPLLIPRKVIEEDKEKQTGARNHWHEVLIAAAEKDGFDLARPRFGKGVHMTSAVYDGEFRQTNVDGLIDIESTVAFLKSVQLFHHSAVAESEAHKL